MNRKLTLASLFGGALQEKVNRALYKVAENILDPNTAAKTKRTVTIKLSLTPDEIDREDVKVNADVTYTLAPEDGVASSMYMQKDLDTGRVTVSEYQRGEVKGQLDFGDIGLFSDDEEDVDMETGEIINKVVDIRREA